MRTSFVVRVVRDRRGEVSGIIERVATGAKETFTGMEAIGGVIVRMLQGASGVPRVASGSLPAGDGKPALGARPSRGSLRRGATH
jgi:hypothetical protein